MVSPPPMSRQRDSAPAESLTTRINNIIQSGWVIIALLGMIAGWCVNVQLKISKYDDMIPQRNQQLSDLRDDVRELKNAGGDTSVRLARIETRLDLILQTLQERKGSK